MSSIGTPLEEAWNTSFKKAKFTPNKFTSKAFQQKMLAEFSKTQGNVVQNTQKQQERIIVIRNNNLLNLIENLSDEEVEQLVLSTSETEQMNEPKPAPTPVVVPQPVVKPKPKVEKPPYDMEKEDVSIESFVNLDTKLTKLIGLMMIIAIFSN